MKRSTTHVFPKLEAGERTVIEHRASCKNGSKTGWRPGRLFLTEKRLFFAHDASFALTISFEEIKTVRIRRGLSVLVGRRLLEITCASESPSAAKKVLLSVNDATSIARWLCCVRTPLLGADAVHQIASELDKDENELLRYLAEKRYANTAELARLLKTNIDAVPQDVELKINAMSRRIAGGDLIVYREWWFDVPNSCCVRDGWWLSSPLESLHSVMETALLSL